MGVGRLALDGVELADVGRFHPALGLQTPGQGIYSGRPEETIPVINLEHQASSASVRLARTNSAVTFAAAATAATPTAFATTATSTAFAASARSAAATLSLESRATAWAGENPP